MTTHLYEEAIELEKQLQARANRRAAAEDKAVARRERLEARAEAIVGELCRNGRTIYYVVGLRSVIEFDSRIEAIDFCIRNRYV